MNQLRLRLHPRVCLTATCLAMVLHCTAPRLSAQDQWPRVTDDPLTIPAGLIQDEMMQTMLLVALQETSSSLEEISIEFQALESSLAEETARFKQLQERSEAVESMVRDGGYELESVVPNLIRLEQQRLQLDIDLAGKTARYRSALQQIEELQHVQREAAKDDVILERLESLLELEKAELDRLRRLVTAAVVSENELSKSISHVAETEIRIAERKEDIGSASGDPRVEALRTELFQMSLDIAEIEARRDHIKEQLVGLKEARDQSSAHSVELQGLQQALPSRLIDLRFRINDLRTKQVLLKLRKQRLQVRFDEFAEEDSDGESEDESDK